MPDPEPKYRAPWPMARGQMKSPGLRQSQGNRPDQSRDRVSCETPERKSFFSQQTANNSTNELTHFLTSSIMIGNQGDHHNDQNYNQLEQERNPQGSQNPQPAPSDYTAELKDNESNGQEAGETNSLNGGLVSLFHDDYFLSVLSWNNCIIALMGSDVNSFFINFQIFFSVGPVRISNPVAAAHSDRPRFSILSRFCLFIRIFFPNLFYDFQTLIFKCFCCGVMVCQIFTCPIRSNFFIMKIIISLRIF